jgi:uncharacterized protein
MEVLLPDAVRKEVVIRVAGKSAAELVASAKQKAWIRRQSVGDTFAVMVLQARVGLGEAEAITLAKEVKAGWVLLDDDLARAHASSVGLRVKGTAGILLAGYKADFLVDLKEDLDKLRSQGFWLGDQLYRAILPEGR